MDAKDNLARNQDTPPSPEEQANARPPADAPESRSSNEAAEAQKDQSGAATMVIKILKEEDKLETLAVLPVTPEPRRFEQVMESWRRRVVGQDELVHRVAVRLETYYSGLAPRGRPVGVFLLVGPTGCGKTHAVIELARSIAEVGGAKAPALIRIDCAELHDSHEVARLVGAPAGYVGHDNTDSLCDRVQEIHKLKVGPAILLLDEIEKAHPRLDPVLLGIFDAGRLTDGRGTVADFTGWLIFMTSNLGVADAAREARRRVGFAPAAASGSTRVAYHARAAAEARFSPEFMGGLTDTVVATELGPQQIRRVAELELERLIEEVEEWHSGIWIRAHPGVVRAVLEAADYRDYGARRIRTVVDGQVRHAIAHALLDAARTGAPAGAFEIYVEDGRLACRPAGATEGTCGLIAARDLRHAPAPA